MCELEVWTLVDSNGDYGVGADSDEARASYVERVGNVEDAEGFRLVRVTLSCPLPAVVELSGTVPAEGKATLSVG